MRENSPMKWLRRRMMDENGCEEILEMGSQSEVEELEEAKAALFVAKHKELHI